MIILFDLLNSLQKKINLNETIINPDKDKAGALLGALFIKLETISMPATGGWLVSDDINVYEILSCH